MTILEAKNLFKTYDQEGTALPVLKGVDLAIQKGECLFLLGPSGAGKSTLLHLLASLDKPSQGDIFFEGQSTLGQTEPFLARMRRQHFGFIFQFHYLLSDFSALENVMMPLLIQGQGRKEAAKKAGQILTRLGLQDRLKHRPAALSGGERQRVAAARALITDPSIVFADEPTGNLDSQSGELLVTLLLDYHRERKGTLIFVTHNEDLPKRVAATGSVRSVCLVDGKVL